MHPEREKLLGFYGNERSEGSSDGLLSRIIPSNEWLDSYGVWDGRKIFDWSTQVLGPIDHVFYGEKEVDLQCLLHHPKGCGYEHPIRLLIGHAEQKYNGKSDGSVKTWIFQYGLMVGYYKPKILKRMPVENMRVSIDRDSLEIDQALCNAYVQVFHPITGRAVWAPHWYDHMDRWWESNHGVPVILTHAMRVINYRLTSLFDTPDLDTNPEYQRLLHEHGVGPDYELVQEKSDEYAYEHRAKCFWARTVIRSNKLPNLYGRLTCPISRIMYHAFSHPYQNKRGKKTVTPRAVFDFYQRVRGLSDDQSSYGSIEERAATYAELIKDFRSLMIGVQISGDH